MSLQLTLYPAMDGDCLLVNWGSSSKTWHMIIDLGRNGTYKRIRQDLAALGDVELFVMSHIDADHIAGAIPMVRENVAPLSPKRVWYNARPQLAAAEDRHSRVEPFGSRQGEKLARGIVKFQWPWNREFESEIVSTDSDEAKEPISIAGGLTLRILSPSDTGLVSLLPNWDAELKKANLRTFDPDEDDNPLNSKFEPFGFLDVQKLANEDYRRDQTTANGAAIAFVAEFEGKRILLAADAHSEVLEAALKPLAQLEGGRYRVDLFKISHHGSKGNTSKALSDLLDCTHFAISTNGDRHEHPDPETIARFLAADKDRYKTFYFNYLQPQTIAWDNIRLKRTWNYNCVFPVAEEGHPANGTLVIDV